MDRLGSMSILVAVAEAGSLSAAAQHLNTPLTTVSRKIADLEHHLKTQLLTRSSRKITLTNAGKSYVAACKRILDDVGEAERLATGEFTVPKGELTITAPIVLGRLYLIPVLSDFLAAYPDIDARLTLADRLVNLTEEGIDAALRVGDLPDNTLVATRIGTIHRVFAASPDYLKSRGTPQKPTGLVKHDCVGVQGLQGQVSVALPVTSKLRGAIASPSIRLTLPVKRPKRVSVSSPSSPTMSQRTFRKELWFPSYRTLNGGRFRSAWCERQEGICL